MNSENTIAIKKLLENASGGTAGESEGWKAEGIERLFLCEYGAEGFGGGCVEVRHGESNSARVRVELELTPALAARVITLVTKTELGEMPDLSEAEQIAIAECVVSSEQTTKSEELAAEKAFSEQDRRNKEIADLIRAQRKDKDSEEEDKAENLKSEDEPEDLDFDLPADVDRS